MVVVKKDGTALVAEEQVGGLRGTYMATVQADDDAGLLGAFFRHPE